MPDFRQIAVDFLQQRLRGDPPKPLAGCAQFPARPGVADMQSFKGKHGIIYHAVVFDRTAKELAPILQLMESAASRIWTPELPESPHLTMVIFKQMDSMFDSSYYKQEGAGLRFGPNIRRILDYLKKVPSEVPLESCLLGMSNGFMRDYGLSLDMFCEVNHDIINLLKECKVLGDRTRIIQAIAGLASWLRVAGVTPMPSWLWPSADVNLLGQINDQIEKIKGNFGVSWSTKPHAAAREEPEKEQPWDKWLAARNDACYSTLIALFKGTYKSGTTIEITSVSLEPVKGVNLPDTRGVTSPLWTMHQLVKQDDIWYVLSRSENKDTEIWTPVDQFARCNSRLAAVLEQASAPGTFDAPSEL